MYKLILVIFTCFITIQLVSQDMTSFFKWQLTTFYSYEKNDKRLYEWPQKEAVLKRQPEEWGTHWYGIRIYHNFLENEFFKFQLGIGYASEIQTFSRPYQLGYFYPSHAIPSIITYTNNYQIHHLQIPISYHYKVFRGLSLNTEIMGTFSIFKDPVSKEPHNNWFRWDRGYDVDFYSLSINTGLSYNLERLSLSINYRIYTLQKIDRLTYDILFQSTSPPDPRHDIIYETYNPTHFSISINYNLCKRKNF